MLTFRARVARIVAVAALLVTSLALAAPADAQSVTPSPSDDTTPPGLAVGVATTGDNCDDGLTVDFTVAATDDVELAGVNVHLLIDGQSPNASPNGFLFFEPMSGTSGSFSGGPTLGPGPALWEYIFEAIDAAGNVTAEVVPIDLPACPGQPPQDVTAPVIMDYSITLDADDICTQPATVTITITASDVGLGLDFGGAVIFDPAGNLAAIVPAPFDPAGVAVVVLEIPPGPSGVYSVDIDVFDLAGNISQAFDQVTLPGDCPGAVPAPYPPVLPPVLPPGPPIPTVDPTLASGPNFGPSGAAAVIALPGSGAEAFNIENYADTVSENGTDVDGDKSDAAAHVIWAGSSPQSPAGSGGATAAVSPTGTAAPLAVTGVETPTTVTLAVMLLSIGMIALGITRRSEAR